MSRPAISRAASLLPIGVLTLTLAGCASTPPPVESLTRAEATIEQANRSDTRRYEAAALDAAQEQLAEAKRAADRRDSKTAERLARRAALDAELAMARARASSAEAAAAEVRESIEALRRESMRGNPDSMSAPGASSSSSGAGPS